MDARFVRGDHYIKFGDGTTGQLADRRRFTSDDGVKKWAFLMWPGKRQKQLYNLDDDPQYDKDNDIILREFDETDVMIFENSPSRSLIIVLRTFDGQPTHLTEREAYLKEEILYLQKEVSSLKGALALAQQDLHKNRVLTQEAVKDWVEIIKVAGEANSKPKMEEYDDMGQG
jgi:hypothetical protein